MARADYIQEGGTGVGAIAEDGERRGKWAQPPMLLKREIRRGMVKKKGRGRKERDGNLPGAPLGL